MKPTFALAALTMIAATPASAAQLMSADFNVVTNAGDANAQLAFAAAGTTYSGSLIFDQETVPTTTGTTNVRFSDIAGVAKSAQLKFNVGSLSFNLANNIDAERASSIQYRNGAFNGIVFLSDFDYAGATYRFRSEGSTFTIKGGTKTFVSGRINSLMNVAPFDPAAPVTPAVPEPATWAMMLIGFGMAAGALRARRKSSVVSFA